MKGRIIVPFLLGVIVSFYFFPIGLTFLPASINTKMILAFIGVIFFFFDIYRKEGLFFSRYTFGAALLAIIFSVSCYFSAVANHTDDMTYATYFVSFFTWLGGAYAVCRFLSLRYGKASLSLLITYLTWVAVAQCISCLLIDNVPAFSAFVDSFMEIGQSSLRDLNRKYSIGAALDPGGMRFAVILVLIAHQFSTQVIQTGNVRKISWYIFAFSFVTLIGNTISRTTSVGSVVGLIYILLFLGKVEQFGIVKSGQFKSFMTFAAFLLIAIPIVSFLYNTNQDFHSDMRFAFEGFFNWRETGEWRTDSTDKLNAVMWIWPTDARTWFIGSGLFGNFVYSTDIGYCRFILYCGLLGFSIFSFFFIYNAIQTERKFHEGWLFFLSFLVLPFIFWVKVATDIFYIYALFMCAEPNEEGQELIL